MGRDWRDGHSRFRAAVNEYRREVWQPTEEQLRGLAEQAVNTLKQALDSGNLKAALEVLRAVKLLR